MLPFEPRPAPSPSTGHMMATTTIILYCEGGGAGRGFWIRKRPPGKKIEKGLSDCEAVDYLFFWGQGDLDGGASGHRFVGVNRIFGPASWEGGSIEGGSMRSSSSSSSSISGKRQAAAAHEVITRLL